MLTALAFDNAFVRDLPGDPLEDRRPRQVHGALYTRVQPTPVAHPTVLAWSREVLVSLGLDEQEAATPEFAAVFGGNALLAGMDPYSANYGGHQFGNWAGQLGDGRAITLGEAVTASGARLELQLKGAGPTRYSRTADGRAVLRSSLREFVCSEAMHHLGVPTTRALCLVGTGEAVVRDLFYDGRPQAEPGAICCRVAPSFVRFGNFELPASRGDEALVRTLADFVIRRDFPELGAPATGALGESLYAEWFATVCERTAAMVAHWQRVGFVHGVMNTDNMSILGLTLDYGPYGWIDNFDPEWTPNTTDAGQRRYRFGQQPQVAYWNLGRLAGAVLSLFSSQDPLHEGLARFVRRFAALDASHTAAKLGLANLGAADKPWSAALRTLLVEGDYDMTLFYRTLAAIEPLRPALQPFASVSYDADRQRASEPALVAWLADYAQRLGSAGVDEATRQRRMAAANPLYVCRNYLAQQAIDAATAGDSGPVCELLDVLRQPYEAQIGRERYAAMRPDWARSRPGCSMLSCSS